MKLTFLQKKKIFAGIEISFLIIGNLQPTAWDKEPCPGDLPPPSDRYKEMYQQYTDDMKQSYRAKNQSLSEVCAELANG